MEHILKLKKFDLIFKAHLSFILMKNETRSHSSAFEAAIRGLSSYSG